MIISGVDGGGFAQGRVKLKGRETNFRLWSKGPPGDSAVEADAQPDQAAKSYQVGRQSAVDEKERDHSGNEVGQQEAIELLESRDARLIIRLQHAQGRPEKPQESDSAKSAKGDNDG